LSPLSPFNLRYYNSYILSPTLIPSVTTTATKIETAIPTNIPTETPIVSPIFTVTKNSTPTPTETASPTNTLTATSTLTPTLTVTTSTPSQEVNNTQIPTQTFTPTPDIVNPIITVDTLTTRERKPTITGTVNDTTSAITVTLNGINYNAFNLGNGVWVLPSQFISTNLTDGLYNVTARATRPSGNFSTDSIIDELTIDNIPPSVTSIEAPAAGIYATDDIIEIALNLSEAGDVDTNGVSFSSVTSNNFSLSDQVGNNLSALSFTPPTTNSNNILVDGIGPAFSSSGNSTLDLHPVGIGLAYGMRRLDKDYVGSAIEVRRSFDNTETNIGFTPNGHLNLSHLRAFSSVNSTLTDHSSFIISFYDQSPNANHAEIANINHQPTIISSGTVNQIGGKTGILFDGAVDRLSIIISRYSSAI
jgi:Bacterial Ig-like domain